MDQARLDRPGLGFWFASAVLFRPGSVMRHVTLNPKRMYCRLGYTFSERKREGGKKKML